MNTTTMAHIGGQTTRRRRLPNRARRARSIFERSMILTLLAFVSTTASRRGASSCVASVGPCAGAFVGAEELTRDPRQRSATGADAGLLSASPDEDMRRLRVFTPGRGASSHSSFAASCEPGLDYVRKAENRPSEVNIDELAVRRGQRTRGGRCERGGSHPSASVRGRGRASLVAGAAGDPEGRAERARCPMKRRSIARHDDARRG